MYIYVLRVVDRCLWKHERYIFLEKKNWKVDIEGNYIEKYYSKIIFIAQNEGYVAFFFTWDTNKLKTNLSIDRFNLQKISICIMNKLVS